MPGSVTGPLQLWRASSVGPSVGSTGLGERSEQRDLTGLTFLRAVRAHRNRADLPFIMVTSQQSQERMKVTKAKKHLVDAYIVKPFRAETLRQKVFQVLFAAMDKKAAG